MKRGAYLMKLLELLKFIGKDERLLAMANMRVVLESIKGSYCPPVIAFAFLPFCNDLFIEYHKNKYCQYFFYNNNFIYFFILI